MKQFHFVFGLKPQTAPFHLVHWLCLESCRQVNAPCTINLHIRHEPFGPYWDRIRPHLTVHRVGAGSSRLNAAKYANTPEGQFIAKAGWDYAHDSDVVRLSVLLEHGGIYADMDSLFVRPYPDAFASADFAMGEEYPLPDARGLLRPSLCNAVIFARTGSAFANTWLTRMAEVFDGTWSKHSCQLAATMWAEGHAGLRVLPGAAFYHFRADQRGLAELFELDAPVPPDVLSIHLWAHLWWDAWRTDFTRFHAGLLTEDWLKTSPATYAQLARKWL